VGTIQLVAVHQYALPLAGMTGEGSGLRFASLLVPINGTSMDSFCLVGLRVLDNSNLTICNGLRFVENFNLLFELSWVLIFFF
jgi:hypothetical protein